MNKKLSFLFVLIVSMLVFLAGCSKKSLTDETGFFMDLDDAEKYAKKK